MGDNHTVSTPEEDLFPENALSGFEIPKSAQTLLYLIGILYVMYAGAVLSYYFFVPSVLLTTEKVKLISYIARQHS